MSWGTCIPLCRSTFEPLHCSLVVLWHTFPFFVHFTQIELGISIALFYKRFQITENCASHGEIKLPKGGVRNLTGGIGEVENGMSGIEGRG